MAVTELSSGSDADLGGTDGVTIRQFTCSDQQDREHTAVVVDKHTG